MSYSVTGVALSNVTAQSIIISGVTVIGASAQEIAEMVVHHADALSKQDAYELGEYRRIYGYATLYVDEFRLRTTDLADPTAIETVLELVTHYTTFIKKNHVEAPLEIVTGLTTLGMLHRLYGQYLQLWEASNSQFRVVPATLFKHRERLTVSRADRGHFSQAETALREAMQICEDKLGGDHPQAITLHNELGLLHRDKGEYKQACLEFKRNVRSLDKHLADKERHSEAYFNCGMAFRDQRRYFVAAYAIWSARVFKESAGQDFSLLALIQNRTIKYGIVYSGIYLVAFLPFATGFGITSKSSLEILLYTIGFLIFMRGFFFVFDWFLVTSISVWVEGVETAVRWPKKTTSSALSDLGTRIAEGWNAFSGRTP